MTKVMRSLFAFLALLAVCSFAACEHTPVCYSYCSTPVEGWEKGDTLHYHVDTIRHTGTYAMTIGIRSSASTPYPYQTLWLVVRQQWHNPETQRCDTVECTLANADGDLTGTGVSVYQYEMPFTQMTLSQGASADIRITHLMRTEMLPGITDVGIKLVRQ